MTALYPYPEHRIALMRKIADQGGRYFYDDDGVESTTFVELEHDGLVDLHEDEDDTSYATLTEDGEAFLHDHPTTT